MAPSEIGRIPKRLLRIFLCDISYERCLLLLTQMDQRLLCPRLFRKKIKYLFATNERRSHLLETLNTILPSEYQFSKEEIEEKGEDYKDLNEELELSIALVNELIKAGHSSKDIVSFNELVKKRKREEMDDEEFYDSAYKFMGGKFGLVKRLGIVLNDGMHPSYIKLPRASTSTSTSSSSSSLENDQVLNNSCSVKKFVDKIDKRDPNYLFRVDTIMKKSRKRLCKKRFKSELEEGKKGLKLDLRKRKAVGLWETRRSELDLLLDMLKCAEKAMKLALQKMKNGKWHMDLELREYLVVNSVKVRLLETMFGEELEKFTCRPLETLPGVVEKLKLKKEEVMEAIKKINEKRRKINF